MGERAVGDAYLRIIIARITRLSTRELWLTISMACRTCATCSSVFSGWTSVVFDTSVSISINRYPVSIRSISPSISQNCTRRLRYSLSA
jgi:hypothetical protein